MSKDLSAKIEFAKHGVNGGLKKQIDFIMYVMIGVAIVLFVAFAAMFLTLGGLIQSYLASKEATYQNLVNKVNEQSVKTDLLYEELKKNNSELNKINLNIEKNENRN